MASSETSTAVARSGNDLERIRHLDERAEDEPLDLLLGAGSRKERTKCLRLRPFEADLGWPHPGPRPPPGVAASVVKMDMPAPGPTSFSRSRRSRPRAVQSCSSCARFHTLRVRWSTSLFLWYLRGCRPDADPYVPGIWKHPMKAWQTRQPSLRRPVVHAAPTTAEAGRESGGAGGFGVAGRSHWPQAMPIRIEGDEGIAEVHLPSAPARSGCRVRASLPPGYRSPPATRPAGNTPLHRPGITEASRLPVATAPRPARVTARTCRRWGGPAPVPPRTGRGRRRCSRDICDVQDGIGGFHALSS